MIVSGIMMTKMVEPMVEQGVQQRIEQYLARSRRMLRTGRLALQDGDYISAVNRAYYAIFYAANALLATKGLERSKHSGVIAAFRQHFVKTGIVDVMYSDLYGAVMEDRHQGDYAEMEVLSYAVAERDLNRAEQFTNYIERHLRDIGAL